MNKKSVVKPSGIGGQAVLEGVMMKNKDRYAGDRGHHDAERGRLRHCSPKA